MMPYILLVILWVAWCALHSAMISLTVTKALRHRFPGGFRFHRIVFNLTAVVTLLPVLLYSASVRSEPAVTWDGPWRVIPLVLGMAALYFFVAGARRYDFSQFLGLRQIKGENACSALTDDCSLDTDGVLSLVRHPWYSGGMLIVWARPLDLAAILTNIVICGYFVVGTILEERKLKLQFGHQYSEYQQQVPMFFPTKWIVRLLFRKNQA